METNFAVGKYQGNGHWNGNTISESKANASGEIRIGEVVGESKFRGTPYVVVKESVKDEVKAMLTSVSNYAESVVKKADYTTPKDVKDMNNYHVDITGIDEEVVYVDADAMVENITAGKIQNGGIKVTLRANQSLVFNVSLKDTVRIPEYKITVKNGSKTHEEMAESVVWNMPYVTNLNLNSDGMRATIIAPKAFVNLGTTSEGWLVCDTVVSNSGEWHMISKKVPKVTPTPKVTATPTPKVTATPTPEVTATATPNLFDFDEDTPRASKELTDPDTPKASATSKKTTTLLDEDVPLSDSAPETGDTTNLLFPMIVMGLSVLAIFGVIVFRKKMN